MSSAAAVFRHFDGIRTGSASAVLTICSKRKHGCQHSQATVEHLSTGAISEVAEAWLNALETAPNETTARNLYAGRAFRFAIRAADASSAPLYVISAGLGLVRGDAAVPVYDLTVSRNGPGSVAAKVSTGFDPSRWFAAVQARRGASPLSEPFAQSDGPVLVALTRPYARLVGPALAALPLENRSRVRIFGSGLLRELPNVLIEYVMPYDDRLGCIVPGTRGDFAQRALADFASNVLKLSPKGDATHHRALVSKRLSLHPVPIMPRRERRSDDEIRDLARREAAAGRPVSIRLLRDRHGIACGVGRFQRLTKDLQIGGER